MGVERVSVSRMLGSVFSKTIRDYRRSLFWWSLSLVGVAFMYIGLYPTIRDQPGLERILEEYPEAVRALFGGEAANFSTGAGYLNVELFSFFLPLLFFIFAIGAASAAIAKEEQEETLSLLLATPISRRRLVLEKLGSVVAMVVLLGVVMWLALVVGDVLVDMELGADKIAAAIASCLLLTLVFGAATLLLGCINGRRALNIGVASGVAVFAYLLNSLAPLADWLEPWQQASPFFYYIDSNPLRNGLQIEHALVLLVLAAVLAAFAVLAFNRRDISG